MPIFNPSSDNLTEKILEALEGIELSGGGGGNPRYRHSASGKVQLTAGEIIPVLPATQDPVSREVRLAIATPGMRITLFWGENPDDPATVLMTIQSGQAFYDPFDGGMRLNAIASTDCEIVVIIRQDVEIDYNLESGDELVLNVNIDLWVDTTVNYAVDISDYDIYRQVQDITGSDDRIAGFKLFYLTSFQLNKPLKINIQVNSNKIAAPIQIQWANKERLYFLSALMGISEHLYYLPEEVINDMNDEFIWAGEVTDSSGGEVTITPTLNHCMARIVAKNSLFGENDTAIITAWTPDATDPTQGGTLTIEGF